MFIYEYGWFLIFWALITLLCVLEALWPSSSNSADRARRWPVNFGFGILNGVIASHIPSLTILSAMWAATQQVGALNNFENPLWLGILITLIIMSFAQYTFHRCAHFFPILWRVHRVHHYDNHLDASSALRFHPFEMIATVLFVAPFVLLFGLPPRIVAAYEVAQIVAGLITHANICVPETLDRGARFVFVTPVLHRFHHSMEDADANSNFCDVFSIWDRVFGTFRDVPRGTRSPEQFGLRDVDLAEPNNFFSQLQLQCGRPMKIPKENPPA